MSDQTKLCPFCKKEILIDAIKCKFCRNMLTETQVKDMDSETYIRNTLASRFTLEEKLGDGGMAVVYKAIQRNLNRPVALKVLQQKSTSDEEFIESFHQEARTAAQLKHQNIVTIFDEGLENGVHFIVMEYVDGQNLHEIIAENGTLTVDQMEDILIPIIEGLGHAHDLGLIHRDIKSGNILIDNNNRSVLIDFGIAQSTKSKKETETQVVLGTPEYMSPEQATAKTTDARSDIYSIGIVMYECLTGRLPFHSDNMNQTLEEIKHNPPTPPRGLKTDIPEKIEHIILRCLAKDPAERYSTCAELIKALHGELEEDINTVIEVSTETTSKAKKESIPMPWWWKSTIAAIVLILIFIIGSILVKMNQTPPPPSTKFGTILVKTEPWATVYIDNRNIGPTPLAKMITAGEHILTFKFSQDGYPDQIKDITVQADDTLKIDQNFTQ